MAMHSLQQNIEGVLERIHRACARSGQSPDRVSMIAVSKTVPLEAIRAAQACGIVHFGENRPQELVAKAPHVSQPVHWHLIGHLQRNKIADIIAIAYRVQSVDSVRVLEALNKASATVGRVLPVYLEVNISQEPQKGGFPPSEIAAAVDAARMSRHLSLDGLMTVAQDTPDTSLLHRQFSAMRRLRDDLGHPNWDLSMGMSNDFEIAVEEGATVVRIGSALFGDRTNAAHTP